MTGSEQFGQMSQFLILPVLDTAPRLYAMQMKNTIQTVSMRNGSQDTRVLWYGGHSVGA